MFILSFFSAVRNSARTSAAESGVAVIELAMVLGVMMIVIGGSISYGLMFLEEQTLIEAIHTGTRTAALNPSGTPPALLTDRVKTSVITFIQQAGSDPARYALKITPFEVTIDEKTTAPGIKLTITRLFTQTSFFGQNYVSSGCFSGSTSIEKSNTAEAYEDDGSSDC